jgi:hypothetical protein
VVISGLLVMDGLESSQIEPRYVAETISTCCDHGGW